MPLIAEAALCAPIQRLLDKLVSSDLLNWARSQKQLYSSLRQWKDMLKTIHAVLNDAENKHLTDSEVGSWLNSLRDLTYDVEDILDALPPTSSSTLMDFVAVEEITRGLQSIKKDISALGLKRSRGEGRSYKIREGRETSSVEADKSRIRGRDLDKADLLQLLQLSPESNIKKASTTPSPFGMGGHRAAASSHIETPPVAPAGKELLVIPIIGMGGIGKTTLARLVYNDDQVEKSFHPRVWVCVSENFSAKELTKTILQKVSKEACNHLKDLDSLQQKLKEKLDGKKFMIVLDDVWSEDKNEWDSLCGPLKAAASLGSTIIVTTRHEGVASSTSLAGSTVSSCTLKGLTEDDRISLLAQHALGANDFESYPELRSIGKQIAKKCKGSPLAAKTLGGLLRDKLNPVEWEDVLKSNIWDLSEEESKILPFLRLSYHHLPSPLKQCFAYLSVFPKGYEFKMDELILLWMAEGFLEQKKGRKKIEDLGQRYFRDLVSRSLLQLSSNNRSRYVMHDLTHDLAQFVAGEICFRLEDQLPGSNTCKVNDNVRHSSYARGGLEVIKRFDPFMGKKCQRTLLALPISSSSSFKGRIANTVISLWLPQFRWLRVLGLSGYKISELPDSIGDLKQLRYLNLSWTDIICLPESVSGLHNLQGLVLDKCEQLSELPRGMKCLTNLRHLSIDETFNLKEMPMGLGSMKCLHKLSKFIVGKGNGLGIQELEHLSDLHGGLLISGLENAVDVHQAIRAKLKEKQHLQELELEWSWFIDDTDNENDQMLVIESLQPHTNIEALRISRYAGSKFPSWMEDPSFSKIVSITLRNCRSCKFLPSLGKLPSLKNLRIEELNQVTSVGTEFFGDGSLSMKPFPLLESLTFRGMENWETWHGFGGDTFSCLRKLSIDSCPKLVKVSPLSLPSLCVLLLEGCQEVVFRSLRDLTSVTSLTLDNISGLVCLGDESDQQLMELESIEALNISNCTELRCLWKKTVQKGLIRLTKFRVWNCPVLEYFGAAEKEGHLVPCNFPLVQLSALVDLRIGICNKFVRFAGMRCPSLRHLEVRHCDAWMGLPEGIMSPCESESGSNICPLEHLVIYNCPSFIRFPEGAMPKTLKRLCIEYCDKLKGLPDGIMNNRGLENLRLSGCSSLKHFPPGELPISLKTVHIEDCLQTELMSEWKMLPNNICLEHLRIGQNRYLKTFPECTLVNLTELQIWDCEGVESFCEGGFLAPNLKILLLLDCNNLRCITDHMQTLTSLQYLVIQNCRGLERFPKAGFPTTLLSLNIKNCKNVKQRISEWGLHKLTSLINFTIGRVCPDMVSFGEEFMPPSSSRSLEIVDFPNLASLSPRLSQCLTSLESLTFIRCPKLWSFPRELLLLPQLSVLQIYDCPNLKRLCQKEKGEYWSYISLLPEVDMSSVAEKQAPKRSLSCSLSLEPKMKGKPINPLITFEHKRDAYGFAVRPQHLQRYREYANIFKE